MAVVHPEECQFAGQAGRNYTMACLTASLFAATIILRPMVTRLCANMELTEEAKKHGQTPEKFFLRVTLNIVGFFYHLVLGPYAAYYFLLHIHEDSANSLTEARTVDVGSTSACSCMYHAGIAGSVFAGYSIWQTLQMLPFIGWEEINVENMVHHLCFTTISTVQCNYYFGAEIVTAAVAMEASTPPLLALLTFRQIVGYEKAAFYSKTMFASLFLLFRVFLYGLAVYRFAGLWLFRRELVEKYVLAYVPRFVFFGIQALYLAGWCLQAYWAITLGMKALRPTKKAAKVSQESKALLA